MTGGNPSQLATMAPVGNDYSRRPALVPASTARIRVDLLRWNTGIQASVISKDEMTVPIPEIDQSSRHPLRGLALGGHPPVPRRLRSGCGRKHPQYRRQLGLVMKRIQDHIKFKALESAILRFEFRAMPANAKPIAFLPEFLIGVKNCIDLMDAIDPHVEALDQRPMTSRIGATASTICVRTCSMLATSTPLITNTPIALKIKSR